MTDLDMLCAAVQEAHTYEKQFTRQAYPGAFRAYTEQFSGVYLTAVRETAGEETAMTALADALLNQLESGWRRQRFWNRGGVRANEKQMVVRFLSPLLLGLEEPLCARFAAVLRDRWAARWPEDAYETAADQEINSGFRYTLMGFEMREPERKRRENRED